jgi:hypothetical protein
MGMVDIVVALTVLSVLALAALNALHAAVVFGRLARHVARRHPHCGIGLWLPVFTGPADVRLWLGAWGDALGSREPAVVALRTEARTVVGRHVYLALLSHVWVLAVSAIAPQV